MTLDQILPPERTLYGVPGGSKKRVLEFFSTFIAQNIPSLDSQEVFSRLIGRERAGFDGHRPRRGRATCTQSTLQDPHRGVHEAR